MPLAEQLKNTNENNYSYPIQDRLFTLKDVVQTIPDSATLDNIWGFLGWDSDSSKAYAVAKPYGIDLRPILAPDFADIVSIVIDSSFGFPYPKGSFLWSAILNGQVTQFSGHTAKDRLLAVIACAIKASFMESLNS